MGRVSRIVSIITNNERWNGVILGVLRSVGVGGRHLPSKGVWVETAVEKEEQPFLVRGGERPVVQGHIKTKERSFREIAVGLFNKSPVLVVL